MSSSEGRTSGRRAAAHGRTGRRALLLAATFTAPLGAVAQDGPLRAAVTGIEASAAADDLIVRRTLCEPKRCDFVWPAQGVPERSRAATLALGAALGAGLGAALGHEDAPGPRPAIKAFGWRDAAILGTAAVAWRLHGWPHAEPGESGRGRISDCSGDCDSLSGLDRGLRRVFGGAQATRVGDLMGALRRRERFHHLSNLTLHATWAQPLGFLVAGHAPDRTRDVLVYVEAFAVAGALTEITKHTFHRPRPFAHFCEPLDAPTLGDDDARLSFFSGHSASAWATATAGWRLAQMRGYRHAGWLKGSGIALATTTGLLRMAADKHYFTDVVVGAVVGWGSGVLVTRLHAAERPDPRPGLAARPAVEAQAALTPAGGVTLGLPRGARLQLGLVAGGPAFALHGSF